MGWKNQLTKTPYLVLFIVLISIGVGTASALITITLAGDVVIDPGDLLVVGLDGFDTNTEKARISLGDSNHYIEAEHGKGVTIGTAAKPNAVFIEEGTGKVTVDGAVECDNCILGYYQENGDSVVISPQSMLSGTASCDDGDIAISGGWNQFNGHILVNSSLQTSINIWGFFFENIDDTNSVEVTPFALCVDFDPQHVDEE